MILIDENRCTLCGLCVQICLRGALKESDKGIVLIDPGSCNLCGHCKAVCPVDAPKLLNLSENEFESAPDMEELPSPSALLRFLRRRRSQRIYKNKPVEIEKLKMLIEAGRFAPTGGNRQGCEYIVVTGRKVLDRVCTLTIQDLQERGKLAQDALERSQRTKEPLSEEYTTLLYYYPTFLNRLAAQWAKGADQLLYHAPALILIHVKEGLTTAPQADASLSAMHMILMAEALELGTCINGFLISALKHSKELRKVLEIPSNHQVHIAFTVGYPDAKFMRLVARNRARIKWIGDLS